MNAPTPRETYEDPEVRRAVQAGSRLALPIEDLLSTWDSIGCQPDVVGHLDEIYADDVGRWCDLKDVLLGLSSETIYQTYGVETLAWAAIHSTLGDSREKRLASLQAFSGLGRAIARSSPALGLAKQHTQIPC